MVYHLAVECTLLLSLPEGPAYVNANINYKRIFFLTLLKHNDRCESDVELEPA